MLEFGYLLLVLICRESFTECSEKAQALEPKYCELRSIEQQSLGAPGYYLKFRCEAEAAWRVLGKDLETGHLPLSLMQPGDD